MKKQTQPRIIRVQRSAYLDLSLLEEAEEIATTKKTNVTRAINDGLKMWVEKNRGAKK